MRPLSFCVAQVVGDEPLPGARRISQGIEPHEFIELRIVDVRVGFFIVTEQIDEGVFSFRPVHRRPAAGCSAIAAATQRQQQQHERELNVECRDDRHGPWLFADSWPSAKASGSSAIASIAEPQKVI